MTRDTAEGFAIYLNLNNRDNEYKFTVRPTWHKWAEGEWEVVAHHRRDKKDVHTMETEDQVRAWVGDGGPIPPAGATVRRRRATTQPPLARQEGIMRIEHATERDIMRVEHTTERDIIRHTISALDICHNDVAGTETHIGATIIMIEEIVPGTIGIALDTGERYEITVNRADQ